MKRALRLGFVSCLRVLDLVRRRVTAVVQSKEAKAFARKVKSEAEKDTGKLSEKFKRRALGVIEESERKLKQAKAMVQKRKK